MPITIVGNFGDKKGQKRLFKNSGRKEEKMYWQIPVILRTLVAHIFGPILLKSIVDKPSRTRYFVWQFIFTAALAIPAGLIFGAEFFGPAFVAIAFIGVINAFAAYCLWRAVDVSQSLTGMTTFADDVICLALGYVLLHETKYLTPSLTIGVILALSAAIIFGFAKKYEDKGTPTPYNMFLWIAFYSIVWGVATFTFRYFALNTVSAWTFGAGWYSGSLVGALLTYMLAGKKEAGEPLNNKQRFRMLPNALITWGALMLAYWASSFKEGAITRVQPIFQVTEMVFPTFIGLYWFQVVRKVSPKLATRYFYKFQEGKELTCLAKVAIGIGIIGGVMCALNY